MHGLSLVMDVNKTGFFVLFINWRFAKWLTYGQAVKIWEGCICNNTGFNRKLIAYILHIWTSLEWEIAYFINFFQLRVLKINEIR